MSLGHFRSTLFLSLLSYLSLSLCQTASWPYTTYRTAPFQPPQLQVNGSENATTPGGNSFLFFAPLGPAEHQPDPLIMAGDGELVWSGPTNSSFFNFGPYTYQGEPVIAYWNGTRYSEPIGRGSGSVYILNKHYQDIANVSLGGHFLTLNGTSSTSNIDLHELYITDHNTLIVTANNVTQTDLSSVGGPNPGWIVNCFVYEIDIASNQVLFEWNTLDHLDQLPLNRSLYPLGSEGFSGTNQSNAWGYFHINSAAPYGNDFVISSRYFCSIIAISRETKRVEWLLQGRDGGDFALGADASFCYQHDVRIPVSSISGGNRIDIITMHDNENCPIDANKTATSGLILQLDHGNRTASLVKRFADPEHEIYVTAQGSFQILPQSPKSVFMGYGYTPRMAEFDYATGEVLSSWTFGAGQGKILSYRAFRSPWLGCPLTRPAVYADHDDTKGGISVYSSWNGATEVTGWKLYTGQSASSVSPFAEVTFRGSKFETWMGILPSAANATKYVQVEAVLKAGAVEACGYKVNSNLMSEVFEVQ